MEIVNTKNAGVFYTRIHLDTYPLSPLVTIGRSELEANISAVKGLDTLITELEKAKAELQAPKNKCGSCVHFRYFSHPEGNLKINGVCFEEQYSAILRDSHYLACPSYERSLSKGAVEEWEESF